MSHNLRPHRSPSPSPGPATINPHNPAKLTRQSLGPPSSSSGAARGFASPTATPASPQPRHVSSSAMPPRDSLSPKPGYNPRSVSGITPRPSSEMMPGRADSRTPEAEQIDQWFKHLASWETTLEEMAAASTDQNFTEELGAIEQWFRVLSEAERTAALYSLLQHSTPVQIRFFLSVLQHMAQSDPMSALLANNTAAAKASTEDRNKLKQNRISAPGTLFPHERWQGQLDQVSERNSPDPDRRSPTPEPRPKSHHYHSPVPASPVNASWASMTNTPLVPTFSDKLDSFANLSIGGDTRYRRRNVSGHYDDDGQFVESGQQPGRASPQHWPRSPVIDQYGLGGLGIGADPNMYLGNAQLVAQAQTAASFAHSGFGGQGIRGRSSPMLKPQSPTPDRPAGGGAGGGAGVAGPDDVDIRTISDVTNWLRVLRLHKYTPNFAKTSWKDMINMNEADLEAKGVNAQGARTKFLKVFYNVRIKMDLPHPDGQEEYAPTK